MTGTVTRALMTRADAAWWDGRTATYDRTDSTGGTLTGLRFGDTVDALQVYGGGTARTGGTLASAVTGIGSASAAVSISPGTWTVDADLTIPANVALVLPKGALLEVASGKTLTLNGPVVAGDYQVFSGAGTVAGFGLVPEVTPRWWGAAGSGDDSTALLAAFASGASVLIPPGTYTCSGNLAPASGVTVRGTGTDSVLKLAAASGANPLILLNTKTDVRITNLKLDCTAPADTSLNAVLIEGDCARITVDHTYVDEGCVRVYFTSGATTDVTVAYNYFKDSAVGGTGSGAIEINSDCARWLVHGNTVYNATGAAVAVFTAASHGRITDNHCEANTGCGVYVDRGDHITISGNVCRANDQSGIGLNTSVAGNNPQFWVVSGNICESNKYDGIDCSLDPDTTAIYYGYGVIANNILRLNGTAADTVGTGLYLAYAGNVSVVGNVVQGNVLSGIELNTCTHCIVSGNHCELNGTKANNTYDGIRLTDVDYSSIVGNVSTNQGGAAIQKYGINESTSCNYNTITGNALYNNATAPLLVTGANTIAADNQPLAWNKMYHGAYIACDTVTPSYATAPALLDGSLWLDTTAGKLKVLESSSWATK